MDDTNLHTVGLAMGKDRGKKNRHGKQPDSLFAFFSVWVGFDS